MNDLGIKSIMLDTSFCIRLMDKTDLLHANAVDYFKYFIREKITVHISAIVIAEYAVVDDPFNLPVNNLQIESFDFIDGKTAGMFHSHIKGNQYNVEGYNRRIIANDVKILAQISNKKIDAIISKDISSLKQFVQPLINLNLLGMKFFDLNKSLNESLGTLFG
jgi:hypothetical protein